MILYPAMMRCIRHQGQLFDRLACSSAGVSADARASSADISPKVHGTLYEWTEPCCSPSKTRMTSAHGVDELEDLAVLDLLIRTAVAARWQTIIIVV